MPYPSLSIRSSNGHAFIVTASLRDWRRIGRFTGGCDDLPDNAKLRLFVDFDRMRRIARQFADSRPAPPRAVAEDAA